MLFDGTLPAVGATMTADQDRTGHGLHLREADARRYRSGA